uniref:Uncharacterized protein n=1 Tax=Anguilla anguilla TaxID=7936 RepID=A0A0E9WGC4_ANGAN
MKGTIQMTILESEVHLFQKLKDFSCIIVKEEGTPTE